MRLNIAFLAFGLSALLSGCVVPQSEQVSKGLIGEESAQSGAAADKFFTVGAPVAALRSNPEMAQDFLDLAFRMESGRALPVLSRFEGPISVVLTGDVPAAARADLARVISRLRNEAGIDIRQVAKGAASVTIDFQPKSALRRAVPTAACFVVPNVTSFDEYRASRNKAAVDWSRVAQRERVAILVPSDTSPQEIRDCLHEELAQSIGPLNDLFRLPDSVFNDDNFHSVLTGFDMLMLRAYYAPELRSGMNEAQVAAVLPSLLDRLNTRGAGPRLALAATTTNRAWITTAEQTFGAKGAAQLAGANRMIGIAHSQGWADGRLAFSHFARARALTGQDLPAAIGDYTEAARIWRTIPGAAIQVAHVDMQLAAFGLSAGQFDQALRLADRAIPVARQHQNASLLASLLAMRAEALDGLGRAREAGAARADSLTWARYAFGSDAVVRARLKDIAALASRGRKG